MFVRSFFEIEVYTWYVSLSFLQIGSSTNTLSALQIAFADEETQVIYLLTDGRPDQVLIKVGNKDRLTNPLKVKAESENWETFFTATKKLLTDACLIQGPRSEVKHTSTLRNSFVYYNTEENLCDTECCLVNLRHSHRPGDQPHERKCLPSMEDWFIFYYKLRARKSF